MLKLGRELRLPDQLVNTETDHYDYSSYVLKLLERLEQAHNILRERQLLVKTADSEEPPLFHPGDLVLLVNKQRRRGENPKPRTRFVGPYIITESFKNHTYRVKRQGQESIQNKSRMKLHCMRRSYRQRSWYKRACTQTQHGRGHQKASKTTPRVS